jgi:muramoyltetrapeptide carboxypeptidase LdcA involved in peptidoglycan recycling
VPSVSRQLSRLGVLSTCAALLLGAFAGCSTTQEKAERQQAESKRILEQRAKRQQRKKQERKHRDGGKEQ